jgi:hypothetical protein
MTEPARFEEATPAMGSRASSRPIRQIGTQKNSQPIMSGLRKLFTSGHVYCKMSSLDQGSKIFQEGQGAKMKAFFSLYIKTAYNETDSSKFNYDLPQKQNYLIDMKRLNVEDTDLTKLKAYRPTFYS